METSLPAAGEETDSTKPYDPNKLRWLILIAVIVTSILLLRTWVQDDPLTPGPSQPQTPGPSQSKTRLFYKQTIDECRSKTTEVERSVCVIAISGYQRKTEYCEELEGGVKDRCILEVAVETLNATTCQRIIRADWREYCLNRTIKK